ncbi:hypothetical protein BaRGS_00006063 [Batillaria attramentaria]|uniref:Uncharacterized protein n=1 Tax=Batillaria attramentaria TaxID=370345 RepID=A0ABD0LUD8_9CAEN
MKPRHYTLCTTVASPVIWHKHAAMHPLPSQAHIHIQRKATEVAERTMKPKSEVVCDIWSRREPHDYDLKIACHISAKVALLNSKKAKLTASFFHPTAYLAHSRRPDLTSSHWA